MVPPADPAAKAPAPFAKARLSPEEAERLAATFRPCWELDEAPFTGPGEMSDSEIRDLQGGGLHADVRAAASTAYATNGSHAPPAPTVSHEPENSVIIDRSITADDLSRAPRAATAPAAQAPSIGPTGTVVLPPELAPKIPPKAEVPASARRQAVPALTAPAARAKAPSIDFDEVFPRKSKKGLWVGVAVVVLGAAGFGIWSASNTGSDRAQAPIPVVQKPAEDKASAIPPPPPETPPPPAPPPPGTVAMQPPTPTPPLPPAVVASPLAAPPAKEPPAKEPPAKEPPAKEPAPKEPPAHVAAAPRAVSSPAPRPAPRPKAPGQTIVRDVPF